MLTAWHVDKDGLVAHTPVSGAPLPSDVVWFDLVDPTTAEEALLEEHLHIDIPTREEMEEIESSSRLYVSDGAMFVTMTVLWRTDTDHPSASAATFILTPNQLVTIRYHDPRPFRTVAAKFAKACPPKLKGPDLFIELTEAIIDRLADLLERASADIEATSLQIFQRDRTTARGPAYKIILKHLGHEGGLNSKARESLLSIQRAILFLANDTDHLSLAREQSARLRTMSRDVQSLSEHVSYLAEKIAFLLDATLGMVTIDQNDIIKLFSVVSVVLMPPTLVASIYGMNFRHMPELEWTYGYPFALMLMLIVAVVPFALFKWKRWF